MTSPRPALAARLKPHLSPLLLLMIVTIAVYGGTVGHDFLINWDDDRYVTGNEAVRGLTLAHLQEAFSTFYVGNYAPVQIVSYMLDHALWGMRASGFLATNVLIHGVNTLLFYGLIFRLQRDRLWACLAAFIFLVHPVQVESVAWISQRKNLLAMLFFLGAFHLYVLAKERGRPGGLP